MAWAGQAAVITGAASGIGEALARRAAARGMRLMLADMDEAKLLRVGTSLRAAGADVAVFPCDVSAKEQVDELAARTIGSFGAPHLLINNAGVSSRNGLIWETPPSDWDWVFGVNVYGVVNGIRSFVPAMIAAVQADPSFRGRVVNVASMGGLFNPALCGPYSASKHAVVSISETLFHDFSVVSARLRCSVVCPFYVSTNINRAEDRRPERFHCSSDPTTSQLISQDFSDQGMASAKLGVEEVSELVFDGIEQDRFYILPHPKMLRSVRMRMEDILGLDNPREPFSFRPEIAERLRRELGIDAPKSPAL